MVFISNLEERKLINLVSAVEGICLFECFLVNLTLYVRVPMHIFDLKINIFRYILYIQEYMLPTNSFVKFIKE